MYANLDMLMRFLAASDVAYSGQIVDDDTQNQDLVVRHSKVTVFIHRTTLCIQK
jgi:hypothetical protein